MDITKIGVHHLPKKTAFFKCENGNFYINEDNWIWFSTFRDVNELKLQWLYNDIESIESEIDHCRDLFERQELQSKKSQINEDIKKELQDEIDQPYRVKITDKQFSSFLSKMKEASKDSVRSIAWKVWCPLDFWPDKQIIPNVESFPWEWIHMKKA